MIIYQKLKANKTKIDQYKVKHLTQPDLNQDQTFLFNYLKHKTSSARMRIYFICLPKGI